MLINIIVLQICINFATRKQQKFITTNYNLPYLTDGELIPTETGFISVHVRSSIFHKNLNALPLCV